MNRSIKILGLAGSLRAKSINKGALRASQELLPENASLDIADLSQIPFFNEDLEEGPLPQAVADFIAKAREADAILFATPEYNYSIPPVLKNALDWASREDESPLDGKPAALLSASLGMGGGMRVQYHLRQVCVVLNLEPINDPEVFIPYAAEKFDSEGHLTDERTRKAIKKLLEALFYKALSKANQ